MAISGSSLNLKAVNKTVSSLSQGLRKSQQSSTMISKSLLESNRDKRKSLSKSSTLFRRRREANRRREKEDIIEASGVMGAVRRTGKVVMRSTKGFLGRILDYLGTVLIGWSVVNLPKIIKMAEDLIMRMRKYFGILQDFTGNIFNNITTFIGNISENITALSNFNFDFFRVEIDKILEKMDNSFTNIRNSVVNVYRTFSSIESVEDLLEYMRNTIPDFSITLDDFKIPGLDNLFGDKQESQPTPTQQPPTQQQEENSYTQSAEMYRIAAALTTEGNSDQGYADMMQVVANRQASGYGETYTDVLAADGQFAGVSVSRNAAEFVNIETLDDASKWSGQSKETLLKVIKLMTDPARQASAASFVKGALEFRGSPATIRLVNSDGDPTNNVEADADGRLTGSVWRGTSQDNQFIIDNPPGSTPVPIRGQGPADVVLRNSGEINSNGIKIGDEVGFKFINKNRDLIFKSSEIASAKTTDLMIINRTIPGKTVMVPPKDNGNGYSYNPSVAMVNNTWDNYQLTSIG